MKAIVFVGQENNHENYQLLLGKNYISISYQMGRKDHKEFLGDVSSRFAEMITKNKISLELGVLNGQKITNERITKTEKIDTELFESLLTNKIIKLSDRKFLVIPATNVN